MKYLFLLILFYSLESAAEVIKVRLNIGMESVILSGQSLSTSTQRFCTSGVTCSVSIKLENSEWLIVSNNQIYKSSTQAFRITGKNMRLGSKAIPSMVELFKNSQGGIDVIAHILMDDYLLGVVSSEMPMNWPIETLKAQAVAARSYTKATLLERKHRAYHLESSILDQVFRYRGPQKNQDLKLVRKAIGETSGQYLVNSKNKIIKAFYHADCGGETKSALDVWKMSQNYGTARDPYCQVREKSRWQMKLSKDEVLSKLSRLSGLSLNQLPQVNWATQEIKFHKDIRFNIENQEVLVAANDLRKVVGFKNLRSTSFQVLEKEDGLVFKGQGFGHGVGLCQWGSWELGKRGKKSTDILKHYFPKAQIRKLY